MKKIISIFAIAIMICLPFSFKCVHSSPSDVVVSLQINNKMMKINGQTSEVDAGRATTPVIVNDRTLVPIRAIIEAFGGDVEDDAQRQTDEVGKGRGDEGHIHGLPNAQLNEVVVPQLVKHLG